MGRLPILGKIAHTSGDPHTRPRTLGGLPMSFVVLPMTLGVSLMTLGVLPITLGLFTMTAGILPMT